MNVFPVPGTERVERFYRCAEDRFEEACLTVLVAVTRAEPFGPGAPAVVQTRVTTDGRGFGLFRVPKCELCR